MVDNCKIIHICISHIYLYISHINIYIYIYLYIYIYKYILYASWSVYNTVIGFQQPIHFNIYINNHIELNFNTRKFTHERMLSQAKRQQ